MPTTPSTLLAWRQLRVGETSKTAWQQFEPFFHEIGYRLFVLDPDDDIGIGSLVPPAGCSAVRSEDEYNRFLPECLNMEPKRSLFYPTSGIHIAARSPQNTDVVIRIMAIRNEGQEHLAIMRALAAPDAQVPENRTVPMLEELQKDDVVFGVFPFMWHDGLSRPWFRTVREVLEALEQTMEGLVYLHERLIAHRDFALGEVFSNYGYDWDFERIYTPDHCLRIPCTFRSVCPDLRYFINDFELSVQYTPDSDPKTRLVSGNPIARYGYAPDDYCKPLAPEALSNALYCPFKADIYRFGLSAANFLGTVDTVPGLQELFVAMGTDDPDARPTAAEALATLRVIRQNTLEDELNNIPTDMDRWRRRLSPGDICDCSFCRAPKVQVPYKLNLECPIQQVTSV